MANVNRDTILIWGAGAIGGTIGAYWARAGHDVLFVDQAADHVEAMNRDGLSIEGPVEEFRQPVRAVTPDRVTGAFERVVLAVKAHHTGRRRASCCPTFPRTATCCRPRTASTRW
jgi:2-dehydropantoate 2-reductase